MPDSDDGGPRKRKHSQARPVGPRKRLSSTKYEAEDDDYVPSDESNGDRKKAFARKLKQAVSQPRSESEPEEEEEEESEESSDEAVPKKKKNVLRSDSEDEEEEDEKESEEETEEKEETKQPEAKPEVKEKTAPVAPDNSSKVNGHDKPVPQKSSSRFTIDNLLKDGKSEEHHEEAEAEDDLENVDDLVNYLTQEDE